MTEEHVQQMSDTDIRNKLMTKPQKNRYDALQISIAALKQYLEQHRPTPATQTQLLRIIEGLERDARRVLYNAKHTAQNRDRRAATQTVPVYFETVD